MAELFGSFGMGLVQGLATSTDKALSTHIKDNKDRFDKNLEAALTRNLERSTRYDKKSREARDALDLVAGLTGGDLGRASEIIQGIGGVAQTQGFVDKFRAAQTVDKNLNFSDVVNYAKDQQGTLTPQQAIDQILTPFTFTTPPQAPKKKGLLSILDDPRNMAVQAKKEWLARGNTIREVDDIIKRQGAKINYNKLATPDQLYAMRLKKLDFQTKELGRDSAQQAIKTAIMNNKILAETVKAAPEQSRLNMEKLAQDVKMGRFNYETAFKFDRPALEIGYAVQEATLLDKRSGPDYEGTIAKVDAQVMITDEELDKMRARGVDVNSKQYRTLLAKQDATKKHQKTIKDNAAPFLAASSSSQYTKINAISQHNSAIRRNMTANGVDFEIGADGKITNILKGEHVAIFKAYRDTYKQLEVDKKFPAMHSRILESYAQKFATEYNAVNAQFKINAEAKGADKKVPKFLFKMTNGVLDKKQGKKIFNPDLKEGDFVMINSAAIDDFRKKEQGYNDFTHTQDDKQYSIGIFVDRDTILGRRSLKNNPYYKTLLKNFSRN